MDPTAKILINGYIQKAEKKLEVAERLLKAVTEAKEFIKQGKLYLKKIGVIS